MHIIVNNYVHKGGNKLHKAQETFTLSSLRRHLHEPGLTSNPGQCARGNDFTSAFTWTRVEDNFSQPGSAFDNPG